MSEIDKATMEEIRKRAGFELIAYGPEIMRLPYPFKTNRTKPYTCAEIGRELGRHSDTIASWFKDVPGVITKTSPAKRMKDPKTGQWKIKQKHTKLLIPASVYMKWLREHTRRD